MRNYYIFIALLGTLVLACLITGLAVGGNPIDLKDVSYDSITVNNLASVKYSIQSYYQTNGKLPTALTEIQIGTDTLKNAKTQKDFEYSILSPTSYKICTDFATDSDYINKRYGGSMGGSFEGNHKKGYDCITYNVDELQPTTTTQNNNSNPMKEGIVKVTYSKLDPNSKLVGQDFGQITTNTDLAVSVGPQAKIFTNADHPDYYLFAIHIDPECAKTAKKTCDFLLSDLELKNKNGATIVKNEKGDSLYTSYVFTQLGEVMAKYNLPPNTGSGGYMGFYIPTYELPQNTPTEFYMKYGDSEALTITLTRN